ncbi:MAG: signal recognition particle-docking protein FtsY [Nevskia sp.]|nr:signal recognition particle-docking protein FtsY [Nevskia sp.]
MPEEKKGWLGRTWDVLNAPIALPGTKLAAEHEPEPGPPAPAEAPPAAAARLPEREPVGVDPLPTSEVASLAVEPLVAPAVEQAPAPAADLPPVAAVSPTTTADLPPVAAVSPTAAADLLPVAAISLAPAAEVVPSAPAPAAEPPSAPAQPAPPPIAEVAAPAAPAAEAEAPAAKPSWWEILNTPITFGPTKEVEAEETLMAKLRLKMGYAETPEEAAAIKSHWLEKFQQRLQRTREQFVARIERLTRGRTTLDDELLEELEEILLQSDVGVTLTEEILGKFQKLAKEKRFLPEEIMPSMLAHLRGQLTPGEHGLRFEPGKLNIVMLVGVNGTGKTTTAGKLALRERVLGRKVILAAADTFRAAATEQLQIWAQRVGVEIVHHREGADAGAVVFDALQAAKARAVDVVIIDTAGRLHTKYNLMEEMKKLRRIMDREAADAATEVLLVLDANTGQNGLRQAEAFGKAVGLTGVILTKLDGTAKGGVIFAIQAALELPIKLIGVGEGPEDLQEFDPELFVQALFAKPEEVPAA